MLQIPNIKQELKKKLTEEFSKIVLPKRLPDMIYPVEVTNEECFYGCRKEIIVEKIYGEPTLQSNQQTSPNESKNLKKYTLDISSGVKDGAILKFEKEGCQPTEGSHDFPGDLIFKIKVIDAEIPDLRDSGSRAPAPEGEGIRKITVDGYDIRVEVSVNIFKILFGGSFIVKYFTEEFEISTTDFPDSIIEESKEYQLANLGVKREDGSRGILTLVIKYNYEEAKKITEKKKEKIKDILEN